MKINDNVRSSDEEKFRQIYEMHHKNLYAYALKLLGDEFEARNAVQDVFTKIWANGMENFRPIASTFTYLCAAVKNKAIDISRHSEKVQAYLESERANMQTYPPADHKVSNNELAMIIEEELAKLSPRRREILEMSVKLNMSYKEIADALGISEGTVQKALKVAKKTVRPAIFKRINLYILYVILMNMD